MPKKIVCMMLALCMVLALSACGTTVKEAKAPLPDEEGYVSPGAIEEGTPLYKALPSEKMNKIDEELPVAIDIRIDHGGAESVASITNEADIRECVALFTAVSIGKETLIEYTDNYNGVRFTFADGTEYGLSLNLTNLEIGIDDALHFFELEDFDPFWEYINSRVQPEG